jgi:integrase
MIAQTRVRTGVDVAVSTPKTKASRRTLLLDGKVLEALEQLKTFRQTEANYFGRPWNGDDEFVACKEDGSPIHPDALTRQFKALARMLGLPVIRLHDLRHSYVVLSRRAGIDVSVTSRRIGHAHTSTTLGIYNHVYVDDDAHAVSAVAELLEEQGRA